jgi:hypothetical protein
LLLSIYRSYDNTYAQSIPAGTQGLKIQMSIKEIGMTMVIALVGVAIALRIDAVRKAVGLPPVSTV